MANDASLHSRDGMTPLAVFEPPPAAADSGHGTPNALPSFEDVYREHVGFVWRSLRHLGVREADIEDAIQEVFLVVNAKLATFQFRARLSTWIYGISFRVAHGRSRQAHARRELPTDPAELLVDAPAEGLAPDAALEQRQAEAVLDRILDKMPLEQRSAFTLFELDGYSCEEIAELTAAPLGTVYSRLRLAREAFRRATARIEAQTNALATKGGVR